MIQSPCMKICIFDQDSGYCLGCSRTEEEVIKWKDAETTDEWKKKNLEELKSRMSGWQLDAFLKSYDNKIKEGVSLFKKSLK